MARGLQQVIEQLQDAGGGLSDGQLLARFVSTRDEAAFTALVRRHGRMVLGVCRRLLPSPHDAEDAFQATFLVLARKAASVVKRESVGCWLYGVAYHTAMRAGVAIARRRTRERQVSDMPHPEVAPAEEKDWLPLLDRELNRLPEKYRGAIVLCDLEGRTRKEAARQLGIPEGTLSSRLATGRQMLARRLSRCGVALSAGVVAVTLAEGAASGQVPAALVSSTATAAILVASGQLAAVSAPAVVLMKEVMKAMLLKELRFAIGVVVVLVALGVAGLGFRAGEAAVVAQGPMPGKPPGELEALRKENELLKINLQVVLEKVRAQELELRELRAKRESGPPRRDSALPGTPPGMGAPGIGMPGGSPMGPPSGGSGLPGSSGGGPPPMGGGMGPMAPGAGPPAGVGGPPPMGGMGPEGGAAAPDPLQEAEAAVKALREAKDTAARKRAADALEKAIKKLKESPTP